eukprot:jgi/Mesvir1/516/Mv11379-RA.1
MMASGDENASETGDLPRGFASRVEEIYVNHGRNASAVAYFIAAELGSEYPKILLRSSENKLRSLAEKLRIFGFEINGYDTREELAQNISAKVAKMLAQGTTGITNDEEPNGDSSEEDTDVGEALAGAKEEQAQGFRPPGASTVAGAPGVGSRSTGASTQRAGRGRMGGAGAAGPSPAGWTSGPHGYPGTPTGVERTQGPAYAYPGQMGAAWPQPYPPAGTAYGTWVPAAGTPYHMALAAAQGGQRKRESKRSKCRECGHRHCRCTSSDSTSSDSEGSGRGRAGGRGKGGRLTDLPVTRGVNLLEYLPAGRALSVVWDVEDHKYHQRTAPKHMETAIQGHNGNMVAWLNVQRAPVLRQQKEGTGLGWASKERMELAQNLCHVWDTLNKELSPNVCSELAGVEYLALCVEALLLVETSGSWNASGYMLPYRPAGGVRTRAARRALRAHKAEGGVAGSSQKK